MFFSENAEYPRMKQTTRADRLRDVARDRWGDGWTLKIEEYADGSRDHRVVHSRGVVETDAGPAVERDRLLFDADGRIVRDRVQTTTGDQLSREVVERPVDE